MPFLDCLKCLSAYVHYRGRFVGLFRGTHPPTTTRRCPVRILTQGGERKLNYNKITDPSENHSALRGLPSLFFPFRVISIHTRARPTWDDDFSNGNKTRSSAQKTLADADVIVDGWECARTASATRYPGRSREGSFERWGGVWSYFLVLVAC